MSVIKKLAGETAIYGLSSMLGRVLFFLLTPLYTTVLAKEEYGNVTELFAYSSFLIVLFTCRMETAYFRFGTEGKFPSSYPTALWSVVGSAVLLGSLIIIFASQIAHFLHYDLHEIYFVFLGLILMFDALCEIPLAQLRLQQKAKKFATIRLINICINIALNLFFLLACPKSDSSLITTWYDKNFGVGYILLSNFLASCITFLLLLPQYSAPIWDKALWKKMLRFALPLVVVGMAGIINETLDRAIFKWVSPMAANANEALLGEYGAGYKLTMILTLFTQAFRMGAEPFFFRERSSNNAPDIYAKVTKYFIIIALGGLMFTLFFLDILKILLIHPKFWEGMKVVPILLYANLFLGIYYNVSVWYRLADKTNIGAIISIVGAAVTIVLNIWWIPIFGYLGCAYATLVCYFCMVLLCYFIGQKYYKIPYDWLKICAYILFSLLLYFVFQQFGATWQLGILLLLSFGLITYLLEFKFITK
ncbi:MAG: polysaccharide biosynthesis C-terminal domain-containing protein [Saprospiraceae bacterium]|nr:polysaccharide biosynthesis C-terminal domain-containing protein [Saprospiraceae bacterium]MBP7699252.1 polysaccharide biosynthesis C-terminal domain-containing protein [Saprospiraceae bacterium]